MHDAVARVNHGVTGGRRKLSGEHLKRRRLTGAVDSEQTEALISMQTDAEIAHGEFLRPERSQGRFVRLGQIIDDDPVVLHVSCPNSFSLRAHVFVLVFTRFDDSFSVSYHSPVRDVFLVLSVKQQRGPHEERSDQVADVVGDDVEGTLRHDGFET